MVDLLRAQCETDFQVELWRLTRQDKIPSSQTEYRCYRWNRTTTFRSCQRFKHQLSKLWNIFDAATHQFRSFLYGMRDFSSRGSNNIKQKDQMALISKGLKKFCYHCHLVSNCVVLALIKMTSLRSGSFLVNCVTLLQYRRPGSTFSTLRTFLLADRASLPVNRRTKLDLFPRCRNPLQKS